MPYALDDAGRPAVLISSMAMHTQNLQADPRASLLVTPPGLGPQREESDDPLARARLTLMGDARVVPPAEVSAARAAYLARHARAAYWVDFEDFAFWRLEVTDLYFVGGFAAMDWVSAAAYFAAAPDPLADVADGVVEHMNRDHADARRRLPRGRRPLARGALRPTAGRPPPRRRRARPHAPSRRLRLHRGVPRPRDRGRRSRRAGAALDARGGDRALRARPRRRRDLRRLRGRRGRPGGRVGARGRVRLRSRDADRRRVRVRDALPPRRGRHADAGHARRFRRGRGARDLPHAVLVGDAVAGRRLPRREPRLDRRRRPPARRVRTAGPCLLDRRAPARRRALVAPGAGDRVAAGRSGAVAG